MAALNEKTKKRLKYGAAAGALTMFFAVAVIALNIAVSELNEVLPLNIDLTSNSFYTLGTEAAEFLETVDDDVEITVLGGKDDAAAGEYCASQGVYDVTATLSYTNGLVQSIENMAQASDRITASYVDMVRNPSFAAEYPAEELTEGSVIVRSGDKYRILDYNELFGVEIGANDDGYYYYISSSAVERALCSAIRNVTSYDSKRIAVLTGHGEADASAMISMLEMNNFDVSEVNITSEEIDSDFLFVIINAPVTDYSAQETEKLERYLENGEDYGRSAMVFFDAGQPELPNLEGLLEEWGISAGDGVVYETDSSKIYGDGIYFQTEYSDDSFAQDVAEEGTPVTVLGSRPINILFQNSGDVSVMPLLTSSESSVVRPSDAGTSWNPDDSTENGPYSVFALSEKDPYGDDERISRIFVCGTSYVTAESMLNNRAYANYNYFSSIVNSVTDNDTYVVIPEKSVAEAGVNMTEGQANFIGFVIFTVALPVAMLVCGAIVFFRRRAL